MWLLSVLLIFAQGNPLSRTENGTISGVLKTASGTPAAGIRVAAAAANPADPTVVNSLVSLTSTDEAGRYLLEDVPPGRYYVVAGRVDFPTYYPGSLQQAGGSTLVMTPKARIANIDFSIHDESSSRGAVRTITAPPSALSIPIQIRVEDGGKIPLLAGAFYPVLRLNEYGMSMRDVPFSATSIVVPMPPAAFPNTDYRVEILDLPPGYAVKSITYGTAQNAVDVMKDRLRITAPPAASTPKTLVTYSVNGIGLTSGSSSVRSDKTLFVVLSHDPKVASNSAGVRVTGTGIVSDIPIYLSGVPGTVFTDGSFEFNGVPAGRHSVVRFISSSLSHGTSIVVGDRDVDGVKLQPTTILPPDIEVDGPRPAGNHPPGSMAPLATLSGKVVRDASGEALALGGTVTISGYLNAKRMFAINGEGRFEIPSLLPGTYRLQLAVTGYTAEPQDIVIDDGDVEITLRGRTAIDP